ncbi:MAG TPA: Ig-like domain-containing protein [Gemmatimonadales bacterium]|nr:Ig-like domain-containing protein [Gemmatimonadales bacterium]
MTRWPAAAALLALAVSACSDSAGPTPNPTPTAVAAFDGNNQQALVGTALAQPLRVRVTDADADPVAGVTVTWSVAEGGGSVSPASSVTDTDGIAATTFTLGGQSGTQRAEASVTGLAESPVVFTATAMAAASDDITLVATVPIPANYGMHDTYVRDGLAFAFAWNTGLRIYDVGIGMAGGSPAAPALVGSLVTNGSVDATDPSAHNGWWFHNPVTNEARYLFVGQEGPGGIGTSSRGDIHVVDVSDLAHPVEVAFFHHGPVDGQPAGVHNFWMDEQHAILYAAYYNAGVVALDVSGTLSGDLSDRLIAEIRPGGAGNTYTWGVMLAEDGSLYTSDMLSGFWHLQLENGEFSVLGGGNNVAQQFTSDLWVHAGVGYSGTWGTRTLPGNEVKVWNLGSGNPVAATPVAIQDVRTISDLQVSDDGTWMAVTTEYGAGAGLYLYSLASPLAPALLASYPVASPSGGLHTGTIATINGRDYVFAARDPLPEGPAMMVFDVTAAVR